MSGSEILISGSAVIFVGDNDGCAFIVTASPFPGEVQVPAEEEKASKFLDGILEGALKDNKPSDVEKKDFAIGTLKVEVLLSGLFPWHRR